MPTYNTEELLNEVCSRNNWSLERILQERIAAYENSQQGGPLASVLILDACMAWCLYRKTGQQECIQRVGELIRSAVLVDRPPSPPTFPYIA